VIVIPLTVPVPDPPDRASHRNNLGVTVDEHQIHLRGVIPDGLARPRTAAAYHTAVIMEDPHFGEEIGLRGVLKIYFRKVVLTPAEEWNRSNIVAIVIGRVAFAYPEVAIRPRIAGTDAELSVLDIRV
jgi:hypothetical protein